MNKLAIVRKRLVKASYGTIFFLSRKLAKKKNR